jgi:hypothetical protein
MHTANPYCSASSVRAAIEHGLLFFLWCTAAEFSLVHRYVLPDHVAAKRNPGHRDSLKGTWCDGAQLTD